MPEAETLAVRDLCVELPDRTVLRDVSFRIPPGSILGVYGPSGCGKTTLALALLNLLPSPPFRVRGAVLWGDRNLRALSEPEWRKVRGARIALVFQDAMLALNPVLRICTQLAEVMRAHHVERDPEQLLALAGLPDPARILRAYPHQLSGGERQRVTLAQALSCRPGLILADEPFTALDAPRVVELADLFRRLRDETGTSFLVISHSPGVLAYLADKVLRIESAEVLCGE